MTVYPISFFNGFKSSLSPFIVIEVGPDFHLVHSMHNWLAMTHEHDVQAHSSTDGFCYPQAVHYHHTGLAYIAHIAGSCTTCRPLLFWTHFLSVSIILRTLATSNFSKLSSPEFIENFINTRTFQIRTFEICLKIQTLWYILHWPKHYGCIIFIHMFVIDPNWPQKFSDKVVLALPARSEEIHVDSNVLIAKVNGQVPNRAFIKTCVNFTASYFGDHITEKIIKNIFVQGADL